MIRLVQRRISSPPTDTPSPQSWIELRVDWLASPQGSHFSPRKGVVRESNQRTEFYREAVAEACEAWHDRHNLGEPLMLDVAVEAEIVFYLMPPPKSDPKREWPYYTPDLDKLIRATFDGITRGKLWKDDGRCCRLRNVEKRHAATPEETHVVIRVRPL